MHCVCARGDRETEKNGSANSARSIGERMLLMKTNRRKRRDRRKKMKPRQKQMNTDQDTYVGADLCVGSQSFLARHTFERISLAVYWISPGGNFLHANPAGCEKLGYSHAELIRLNVSDIDPDFPPERRAGHWQEFKKQKVLTFETRHRAKDGHVFPVEVIDHYICFEGREYEVAFATDMTQVKEHQRALARKEARYQTFVESLNEGIWTIDAAGITTFANKQMATMLGYARAEIIGKSVFSFIPTDFYKLAKNIFSLADESRNKKYDFRFIKKNTSVLHVTIEAAPILDDGGVYQGSMCGIVDITDKKQAELDLKEQALLLEQKNKALKEVLASIENEKEAIKTNVYSNMTELVYPLLETLEATARSKETVAVLRKTLAEITSSFGKELKNPHSHLSPREKEICNLIKHGHSSKEISQLLAIAPATTERYRNNIRQKFDLVKKKINLATFLQSI
jgi:PAS domain S-box-containing protein